MKIVDRQTFLAMPEGTVFSKYKPCIFDGLFVKASHGGEYANDFLYDDLIAPVDAGDSGEGFDMLFASQERGDEVPLTFSDATTRDGLFDDDQLFAVYSDDDVSMLIHRLLAASGDLYGDI
jgi:hypothetical protein